MDPREVRPRIQVPEKGAAGRGGKGGREKKKNKKEEKDNLLQDTQWVKARVGVVGEGGTP